MTSPDVVKTVAIEEHFWIPKLQTEETIGVDIKSKPRWVEGLGDLGALRLKEMDEAGIDLQVIAHAPPGAQNFPPDQAVALAREANDTLYRAIGAHPDRFAGFAALPTPDPEAAAAELERAVTKLGFKGAMIYGLTHGAFTDEKRFWCIYERAAALDVPIYIHPGPPHRPVVDAYFKDYPTMDGAGLGFTFETAAHAIRLSICGLFDAYPTLRLILGHMGEGLPFLLWRCDMALSRDKGLKRKFRDYFREHFYITTSGNFSHPALLCTAMEMSTDRIIFAVDWPYASNKEARAFIDTAPLSPHDKDKICYHNVAKLLKL
ncbi:MAG TPA: amidohydrolase family protein [Stellaceae bacterium]|nr:amidohydrolase family protein [Stellaceae bacterium]